jgi:uncharacterized membrane protein
MDGLWEVLEHPAVMATLAVVVVMVIATIGYHIAQSLRPSTGTGDTNVDDLANNFAEMQREGDITDAELRRIKSVLGEPNQSKTD